MSVFIDGDPLFFTKIHQIKKSCQSYRRFQVLESGAVKWRLIFEIMKMSVVSGEWPRLVDGDHTGFHGSRVLAHGHRSSRRPMPCGLGDPRCETPHSYIPLESGDGGCAVSGRQVVGASRAAMSDVRNRPILRQFTRFHGFLMTSRRGPSGANALWRADVEMFRLFPGIFDLRLRIFAPFCAY